MNPTPYFFILSGERVSLYCKTISFDGTFLNAEVINGAWTFIVNVKTGFMTYDSPSGHCVADGCEVMWLRGRDFDWDYDAAIEWGDARLAMWWPKRLWHDVADFVRPLPERLRRSCKAFSAAWNGKTPAPVDPDIDQICF